MRGGILATLKFFNDSESPARRENGLKTENPNSIAKEAV